MAADSNPFSAFAFGSTPAAQAATLPSTRQRPARTAAAAAAASPSPRSSSGREAAVPPAKRQRTGVALTGPPRGLREKLGGAPLRLILVGHNPSEHAWHAGHYYANPSNRMWPILRATGIAPPDSAPEADDTMPSEVGVGFLDVGTGHPGTDSALFTSADFAAWRGAFYTRLTDHMRVASASIGCTCGSCGAPALVAFTGKRQFMELLNLDAAGQPRRGKAKVPGAAVALGRQPAGALPPGWPLPASSEVWVMTSTSGAAPMSNAEREAPYMQLAARLAQIAWPRAMQLACGGVAAGPEAAATDPADSAAAAAAPSGRD